MAGSRNPGPQSSYNERLDVDPGTMCLAQPHQPGPVGITPSPAMYDWRGDRDAIDVRAGELTAAALYRETGYVFDGETVKALVPDLIRPINTLISGGGPVAAHIGRKEILSSLGLDLLTDSIDSDFGPVIGLFRMGISKMDFPGDRRGAAREQEIENAAEALAASGAVFVRLILQSIVAYLTKTLPASKIASGAAVAQLAGDLRSSRLGLGFATWIEKNWKDLLQNPQLRIGSRRSGGTGDRVVSERRTQVPDVPIQPTSDPPTFSSIDFTAQAATLVAAAAQGAPFCPV